MKVQPDLELFEISRRDDKEKWILSIMECWFDVIKH
jgi:hypothetical protein